MVVGLAPGVVELEAFAADVEVEALAYVRSGYRYSVGNSKFGPSPNWRRLMIVLNPRVARYRSKRVGTASWATTVSGGADRSTLSAS